jgi:DNA-binding MarR family transcriptional regulator
MLETPAYLLVLVQRAHRANLAPRLAELRLRPGADVALAEVSHHEGLAHGELAGRLGVTPPNVAKVLGGLERQGLVERLHDPDDARISRIHPTPAGIDLERAVEQAWQAAEADTLAALTEAEATTLGALLAKALRR